MAYVKIGTVSAKRGNLFEWIIDNFFSPQYVGRELFHSPYFSCGSDEWRFGLHVWSVKSRKKKNIREFVDATVSRKGGTAASRKRIRLGMMAGWLVKKIVAGETDKIGTFRVVKWMEMKEMETIAGEADKNKSLIIFCEISDVEEVKLQAPRSERSDLPVEKSWRRLPAEKDSDVWEPRSTAWRSKDPLVEGSWRKKIRVEDLFIRRSSASSSRTKDATDDLPTEDGSADDWSVNDRSANDLPTKDRSANDWSTYDLPTKDRSAANWSQRVRLSNELPVEGEGFDVKIKEIKNISSVKQGKNEKSLDKLSQDLKQLLVSEELCDVVLEVQGERFKAHKNILSARSPVFRSMFHHDTEEKNTGKVNITDCDPGTFPDFLSYLYSGITDTLESGNIYGLYQTADKYCVQELKEECVERMKSLTVETFCDVVALALKYCERELVEICSVFFAQKMTEIILTPKWQAFISENGIAANELFVKALVSKEEKKKP